MTTEPDSTAELDRNNSGNQLNIGTIPSDWSELSRESRSSTVAHFIGGAKSTTGNAEVLVWKGTSQLYAVADAKVVTGDDLEDIQDGEQNYQFKEGITIAGFDEQGPADSFQYVVEFHLDDEDGSVRTVLATSLTDASTVLTDCLAEGGSLEVEEVAE
jgi:hypothetical protein